MFAFTPETWRLLHSGSMDDDVAEFERKLGVKQNFYRDLLSNDDWSFVIKLNALFEAACTHVLSVRLASPELLETLAHLEFADQRKGKVKFLLALNAITAGPGSGLIFGHELRIGFLAEAASECQTLAPARSTP